MNFSKITLLAISSVLALAGASRLGTNCINELHYCLDAPSRDAFMRVAGSNGVIDADEWPELMATVDSQFLKGATFGELAGEDMQMSMDEWVALKAFMKADVSGDGTVSREEFLAAFGADTTDFFGMIDADGSGEITWQEWMDAVVPMVSC